MSPDLRECVLSFSKNGWFLPRLGGTDFAYSKELIMTFTLFVSILGAILSLHSLQKIMEMAFASGIWVVLTAEGKITMEFLTVSL